MVHESSHYDQSDISSDDGQGEVLDRAKEKSIKKMIVSEDRTD